ncbi:NLR family CARD domain-containing protein 3 [Sarotherodon galilaeus]
MAEDVGISLEETSSPYQDTTHILSRRRRRRGRHCVERVRLAVWLKENQRKRRTESRSDKQEEEKLERRRKKEERTEQRGAGGRRKEEKLTGL